MNNGPKNKKTSKFPDISSLQIVSFINLRPLAEPHKEIADHAVTYFKPSLKNFEKVKDKFFGKVLK